MPAVVGEPEMQSAVFLLLVWGGAVVSLIGIWITCTALIFRSQETQDWSSRIDCLSDFSRLSTPITLYPVRHAALYRAGVPPPAASIAKERANGS
jgi:hypothetical protein